MLAILWIQVSSVISSIMGPTVPRLYGISLGKLPPQLSACFNVQWIEPGER